MPEVTKDQVAEVLEDIALMLQLKDENVFKIRAYTNAARAIETFSGSLRKTAEDGKLGEIEGIGKAIAEKIHELVTTGSLAYHTELKAEFPPGIFDMFGIPGMGPKKIQSVWRQLEVTTVTDLETACKDGRVAKLAGFGAKTAANILKGIEDQKKHTGKFRLGESPRMRSRCWMICVRIPTSRVSRFAAATGDARKLAAISTFSSPRAHRNRSAIFLCSMIPSRASSRTARRNPRSAGSAASKQICAW